MSAKLFIFIFMVWLVAMLLTATFEEHSTATASGQAYTAGTATFSSGSDEVVGSDTTWVSGMEGGNIRLDADDIWCRILSVANTTHLTLSATYQGTGGSGDYTMAIAPGWEGSTQTSMIDYLLNYKNALQQLPVMGGIPMPVPNAEYFATWFKIILLQVSFLQQPGYMIVQYFLNAFAILGVLSMILLFIGMMRGNVTWG